MRTDDELEGQLLPEYCSQTPRLQVGIPKRDTIISIDEIADLVILLYTTKSVTEFLGRI